MLLLNVKHSSDVLSVYYTNLYCVRGALSMCSPWWRPRIWFMRIIKWVKAWEATPFDDHPFNSLFVILPNHYSSFCFIIEEPEFRGCLCLILFLLLPSTINSVDICFFNWLGSSSQSDWALICQWSPLYKFEHTPSKDNHSDSYTGWGNMTAVL